MLQFFSRTSIRVLSLTINITLFRMATSFLNDQTKFCPRNENVIRLFIIKSNRVCIPSGVHLSIFIAQMFFSPTNENCLKAPYSNCEKAKYMLTSTNMTVSEIAYELGFEYPQSFSKLFKNKTSFTPLKFRQSFN